MSATRARSEQVRRHTAAKRRHRGVGAVMTSVLVVAIIAVVIVILGNQPHYRVTPAVDADMMKALATVPATDVFGEDPVVRPPGTIRSYYLSRGRVTTVMYTSKQPIADETQATVERLVAAGWKPPGKLAPGHVATDANSFTAVYANKDSVLQVALVHINDITAATYILQTAQ
ncbi:MAG: hypothetical protein ABR598_04715 [Candidatus Dormibacteria bacterium]